MTIAVDRVADRVRLMSRHVRHRFRRPSTDGRPVRSGSAGHNSQAVDADESTADLGPPSIQPCSSSGPYRADLTSLRRHLPRLTTGDEIELPFGLYDARRRTLYLSHNGGICSCLTVAAWSISDLLSLGHQPRRLRFTEALTAYRDDADGDVFGELFVADVRSDDLVALEPWVNRRVPLFDQHGPYSRFDLDFLAALHDAYFRPSARLLSRERDLRDRYVRSGANHVGVCIRGTDKSNEVPPVDSSIYIESVDRLLASGAVDRVLVQTDQAQICDLFLRCFPGRCDVIDAVPRTTGSTVMHHTDLISNRRSDFGVDVLAALSIVASSSHVITHTGNAGAWIVQRRRSVHRVWQAWDGGIEPQWTP